MKDKLIFPVDFTWGTATAAYQVEGAAREDGRAESIWDRFSREPGKVLNQENGDVACDHYHRFREDFDLISDLDIPAYRFSASWARIMPRKGFLSEEGLEFYSTLVDALLKRNIKPVLTIYHWDLPQWLQDEGGWMNRETVDYFLEYAAALFNRLGNRISMWITHNEPFCSAFLGHGFGIHAPGLKDWESAVRAAHHILLSHGLTVSRFREIGLKGSIGITLNLGYSYPNTNSDEDAAAARMSNEFANDWFLRPIFKGEYPKGIKEMFSDYVENWDFIYERDMDSIAVGIDFLGVNYYSGGPVASDKQAPFLKVRQVETDRPKTAMGWDIYPEGLYYVLKSVQSDYTGDLPLYITENGVAFEDKVTGGEVKDSNRINYVALHLEQVHRFIQEGGPLKGYFLWSLMDNYEWQHGYSKRFGIVYVNYDTQERIPKHSSEWYKMAIENNGFVPVTVDSM